MSPGDEHSGQAEQCQAKGEPPHPIAATLSSTNDDGLPEALVAEQPNEDDPDQAVLVSQMTD
jgi:hypothetical protein